MDGVGSPLPDTQPVASGVRRTEATRAGSCRRQAFVAPIVGRTKDGGMDTYPRIHSCCASVKRYPPEAVELSVLPLTRSTTDVKPPKIMRLPSKGH